MFNFNWMVDKNKFFFLNSTMFLLKDLRNFFFVCLSCLVSISKSRRRNFITKMSREDWKLYNVYFELNCPFDYDRLDSELENDNDIIFDGMDFTCGNDITGESAVYGYWFFIHSEVIPSFEDHLNFVYRTEHFTPKLTVDYENFIVRRSSGRTSYKIGQYKY